MGKSKYTIKQLDEHNFAYVPVGIGVHKDPLGLGYLVEVNDPTGVTQHIAVTLDELKELKKILNEMSL